MMKKIFWRKMPRIRKECKNGQFKDSRRQQRKEVKERVVLYLLQEKLPFHYGGCKLLLRKL
jgi:hypothetical protein